MSANKLLKLIEDSKERIVKPNDCYNSGIINAEYQRTSGVPKVENIQISVCYGKPKLFIFWLNGKEILNETISTSKMKFEDGIFKTKYYTLKVKNNNNLTHFQIENMMKQAEQYDNEYLLINYKN